MCAKKLPELDARIEDLTVYSWLRRHSLGPIRRLWAETDRKSPKCNHQSVGVQDMGSNWPFILPIAHQSSLPNRLGRRMRLLPYSHKVID